MEKDNAELLLKGIRDGRKAYIGPEIVQIDLCGKCNNSCIGCWVHSPYIKDPPGDKNLILPFDRAAALIRDLSALGTREIFLSGAGEPFMHPDILRIIALIKSRGMKLNVITNASLLNEKTAQVLVDEGVEMVTASVWAGTAQTYSALHPGKTENDFLAIRENLIYLASRKSALGRLLPIVKIYNVICSLNYNEIGKMVDFSLATGVAQVEFQMMDTIEGQTSFLALTAEQAQTARDEFASLSRHPELYFRDLPSAGGTGSEELTEFKGRFVRPPKGFQVKEKCTDSGKLGRDLICPQGHITLTGANNPRIDEQGHKLVFKFLHDTCRSCMSADCSAKKNGSVSLDFLTIRGYGSFLRRLESVGHGQGYEAGVIDSIPCFTGWVYSRVLATGDVIPCCKAAFKKSMGNVLTTGFSSIWNSPSYREFREKALTLPKSDPYFSAINCYRACDNIGMNLKIRDFLKRRESRDDRSAEARREEGGGLPELPAVAVVHIPSHSFINGNLNRTEHEFGREMLIDGGNGVGFAEYEFVVGRNDMYELWSCYASEVSRPVDLSIDGRGFSLPGLSKVTSGWSQDDSLWFKEGEFEAVAGRHLLKIFTQGLIPHVRAFAILVKRPGGNPAEVIFMKHASLRLAAEKFVSLGPVAFARKFVSHVGTGRLASNYLDIMGIFNGRRAFKGPFHVQIDLTNDCNNDCIACWCNSPLLEEKRHGPEIRKQTLPFAMVRDILDELAASGTREIYFSGGGEPFMHPQIMDVLAYAKKKHFTCYVNTNFTLLNEDKIRRLVDLGVDHLTVSTWAATAATYAATHGNKTEQTFRDIVNNLALLNRLKRGKPCIKLYNVIFTHNYRELDGMVDLARETGSESVEFTLVDTIPGKTDKLLLNESQSAELRRMAQALASRQDRNGNVDGVHLFRFDSFLRRISSDADLAGATYDRSIIDKIPCYIGWCFSRILPNGDVNACLKAHRIPTGNLYSQSFGEIWNGQNQKVFRAKTLAKEKKDVFFRLIGNDPEIKEAGCYKSCDDIGRNVYMHNRIMSLTPFERGVLAFLARTRMAGALRSRKGVCRPGPEQVVVDLTNRCNQRCLACWLYSPQLTDKPDPAWLKKELGYHYVERLINDLAAMGTRRIRFTGGGEPLMHPRIMDILRYAKRSGLITCMTTNLTLADRAVCRRLLETGLDELGVSIWAADRATYGRLHPGMSDGVFERVMDNCSFICASGNAPFVTLCHVITPHNIGEMEKMYAAAVAVKAKALYFTLVDALPGTESLLLTDEQRRCALDQALHIREINRIPGGGEKLRLEFIEGFISRLEHAGAVDGAYDARIDEVPCFAGSTFSRILADGAVCPCCRGVQKQLGNINARRFREIWNSPQYEEFRRKALFLPKSDRYFLDIGCTRMCDNRMHNEEMNRRFQCSCGESK